MFSSNFNKNRSRFNFVFNLVVVIQIVIFVAIVGSIVYLVMNPDQVGSFFGKIVKGFKSV